MQTPIAHEQIRLLYAQPTGVFFGAIVVALAATWTLWPGEDHQLWILLWCLANVALVAGRLYAHRVYTQQLNSQPGSDNTLWGFFYCLCSFSTGTLWGLTLLLFFPDDRYNLAIIMVIHAGYISAAVLATSIYFPAFLCFILSSSILITGGILLHGGWEFIMMAGLSVFYSGMLIFFGIRNNESVADQIKLRMKNTELLTQVQEEADRAQQAMLEKNRFLASASHDLRQPVHALGLQVGNLRKHIHSTEAVEILDSIRESTDGLSDLFHGLLDLSELDADVVDNSPGHHRLSELLLRINTDYQSVARDKGLSLDIDTQTDAVALIDKSLLERVLRNLVSNAIKYTARGGVTLSIEPQDDSLRLSVRDTGQGIPAQEIDSIFSEYHQLENPERDRRKGLGLGLAIVRRLCKLMEIPIDVESAPGKGSTFSIVVPAGKHIPLPVQETAPPLQDISEAIVLIVEDERPTLIAMQQMLRDWGCHVIAATDTDDAMQQLASEKFLDAIVADLRLPNNRTGLETIDTVRKHYKNDELPALLISGDTDPERLTMANKARVKMAHKPVDPDNLRREITSILYPADD